MAKWIRKGTQILNHERFLKAGPHGRDLYDWGMLHTGFFEKDGFIPTIAVETSAYGYGSAKRNLALAEKLIEVGLWGRTDGGFVILRWVEQGNATAAKLEESREEWRAAKAARDAAKKQAKKAKSNASKESPGRTPVGTPERVPYSPSYSSSESRSPDPDPAREEVRPLAEVPDPSAPPPSWWSGVLGTLCESSGIGLPNGMSWIRYAGHRHKKRLPATREDALYWLGTVMVPEEQERRRKEASQRERDKTFAERFPPKSETAPMVPYKLRTKGDEIGEPTPEERAEAQRLVASVGVSFLDTPANDTPKTGTDE